jgi:hypothetical protein
MDIENTDLERRVLAHEWILQALIAHMSEAEPKFLERLQEMFIGSRHQVASEHDYTDTLGYVKEFIEQVARLKAESTEPAAAAS